jgi:hypothetical protein
MDLPSYQHFLPSIRRQDQYPCRIDGISALHFCFACAVGVAIDESVAMQAAKAINGACFLAPHAVKLHARSNQKRGVADHSLTFKSGRNGSKIGPYSQL